MDVLGPCSQDPGTPLRDTPLQLGLFRGPSGDIVGCSSIRSHRVTARLASFLGEAREPGSEGPIFSVSHLYGFGLVDAEAIVLEAKKWTAVPSQHMCIATSDKRPR